MPSLGMGASSVSGRSPHGERGLKLRTRILRAHLRLVALLTESVD